MDRDTIHRGCSRFDAGDEDAARAFLLARPKLRQQKDFPKRPGRLWLLWLSLVLWTFVGFGILLGGLAGESLSIDGENSVLGVALLLPLFLFAAFIGIRFGIAQNYLVVSPAGGYILEGTTHYEFRELGLPRVVSRARNVERNLVTCGSVTLFEGERISRALAESIADTLNAVLMEHNERENVRTWLEQRTAADAVRQRQVAEAERLREDIAASHRTPPTKRLGQRPLGR